MGGAAVPGCAAVDGPGGQGRGPAAGTAGGLAGPRTRHALSLSLSLSRATQHCDMISVFGFCYNIVLTP